MLARIKDMHTELFNATKVKNVRYKPYFILHYILIYKIYYISVDDYIDNKLYQLFTNHSDYYDSTTKRKRGWKNVSRICAPNKSGVWHIVHYFDFLVSRLIYRGLDAADYFHYEFYNFSHAKRKTFITEGNLVDLDRRFNLNGDSSVLTEKNIFNSMFSEYINRKWLYTEHIEFDEFCSMFESENKVIVKPMQGVQGKGIRIADISDKNKINSLYDSVFGKKYMVESLIVQHPSLAKFNPSSVNTIRIYSVLKNGDVHIVSAAFRIGKGDGPTDNYSAGGMVATIDIDTGVVISKAITKDNCSYIYHPVSHELIVGFEIPCWKNIVDTVSIVHKKIDKLRYVAWDIVVTADCQITLVEANTSGGVSLQQQPLLEGKKYVYRDLM